MARIRPFTLMLALTTLIATDICQSAPVYADNTAITLVSVNGGTDTVNPGTTCVQIAAGVSAACSGWLGIPNNNKQLVSIALAGKLTASKVWIYYDDAASGLHCPGLTYTPCSIVSIMSK